MDTDMPLISIIVPVYKVEPYLDQCVASLVNQTYRNLEILLVDDGSPDGCPALCDAWAGKDDRIAVIHKKNGGLSEARNFGIDRAAGAYLSFVDGDDYVADTYVETLYRTLVAQEAEVSACNFRRVDEAGNWLPEGLSSKLRSGVCTGRDMLNRYFAFRGTAPTLVAAWGKLFKRELFRQLRFPVGRLFEDEYVYFPLYSQVGKVAFTDETLYHYVQRQGSILNSAVTEKKIQDLYGFCTDRLEQYQNDPDLFRKLSVNFALDMFGVMDRVSEPAIAAQMTKTYRENIRYVLCSCIDMPLHFKLAYLLVAIAPRTAAVILHRKYRK